MKKRLFIDLDGVLCNIDKQTALFKELFPTQPYVQSQFGFFMDMEPIDGAIESVNQLNKHYDVWFLTAPSYKNPMCYSEKNYWIRKYFGIEMTEKLIICSDKSICIGYYLIDDNNYGRGQNKFTGKLIHFGSSEFKNWKYILRYLIKPVSEIQPNALPIGYDEVNDAPIFKNGEDCWIECKNGVCIPIE